MGGLRHFQLLNCTTELRISEIALLEKILDYMDPYMAQVFKCTKNAWVTCKHGYFLKHIHREMQTRQGGHTYRTVDWGSKRQVRLPKPARTENGFGKALLFVLLSLHGFIFTCQQFLQTTNNKTLANILQMSEYQLNQSKFKYPFDCVNLLLRGKHELIQTANNSIKKLSWPSYEITFPQCRTFK